ncbi:NADPH:quinone reductase [Sphaerisporangium melleum]|uniref:NADPH:quinone reductase n=1 Tax=Sphaerisporangium melleum TaxID=321316 RepID=A0A917RRL5_9ACTN|nr:zinc-binding dehydrogenase [Sphaerisporangium melleum]GGL21117.1 NADPH:quinone reductase [Sphaerisporangium melleum]GII74970.1 NADPH:quinone reductase [Sphaerisporangium melleum]
MRAVRVERFGGPEVLVAAEVPDPVAEPGHVVLDVAAADTLFVETQIRAGAARQWFAVEPPYVPGGAVAGRVIAMGEGVDAAWAGRTVTACTPDAQGGYAERVAVPAQALISVPDGLHVTWAAALMHDGVTGLSVFDAAEVKPGDRVLVTAAAGGMGILLVQLARAAGAWVAAAARGERKLDLARRMGADLAVDYTEHGWTEHVREAADGAGPDVVFDGAGGQIGQAAFAIAARGARFSAHGAAGGGFSVIDPVEAGRRKITVRGIQEVQLDMAERNRLAERAMAEAAAGRLEPVVGRTFPLDRAAEAHAAIEARKVPGKTLLLP